MESGASLGEAGRRVLQDQWLVLARPSPASFQEATAPVYGLELLLAVVPASLLTGLVRLIAGQGTGQGPLEAFVGGVLSNVVVYCMLAGVLLGGVLLARGRGDVVMHLYALGLFWPVLNILLAVPGPAVALWGVAALYGLYLSYLEIRVVYGLSDGAARLVAFTPVLVGALLGLAGWITLFLLAGSTVLTANP